MFSPDPGEVQCSLPCGSDDDAAGRVAPPGHADGSDAGDAMILSSRFVLIELPYGNGPFLRAALRAAPPDWAVEALPAHLGAADIPQSHRHLPRVLVAPNPFHFYAAWFSDQRRAAVPDPEYTALCGGVAEPFPVVLARGLAAGGPLSRLVGQRAGGDPGGIVPVRSAAAGRGVLAALRATGPVPEGLAQALSVPHGCDPAGYPGWRCFYDAGARALVERTDAALFAQFGFRWDEAAGREPEVLPGGLRRTQGVSFPRSGNSALFEFLRRYFEGEVTFCDARDPAWCGCGHAPCANAATNLAKNHDFGLLDGRTDLVFHPEVRYLVQVRSPVRAIASNFGLWLRGEGVSPTVERWQVFARQQIDYWNAFVDKWVLRFPGDARRHLVVAYHELVQEPARMAARVVEFATGRPAPPDLVRQELARAPIRARGSLARFPFFDEQEFDALEAQAGERLRAMALPSWRQAP